MPEGRTFGVPVPIKQKLTVTYTINLDSKNAWDFKYEEINATN